MNSPSRTVQDIIIRRSYFQKWKTKFHESLWILKQGVIDEVLADARLVDTFRSLLNISSRIEGMLQIRDAVEKNFIKIALLIPNLFYQKLVEVMVFLHAFLCSIAVLVSSNTAMTLKLYSLFFLSLFSFPNFISKIVFTSISSLILLKWPNHFSYVKQNRLFLMFQKCFLLISSINEKLSSPLQQHYTSGWKYSSWVSISNSSSQFFILNIIPTKNTTKESKRVYT